MKHLNIQTPEKAIRIDLNGDDMSIVVNPDKVTNHQPSLKWSDTLFDGDAVTLEQAEKAVAKLGDGWRLPTREELQSILDLTRHDPAIDTDRFPDTQSRAYWTSTPCAWNTSARWVVNFSYGGVYDSPAATTPAFVRCVPVSSFLIF